MNEMQHCRSDFLFLLEEMQLLVHQYCLVFQLECQCSVVSRNICHPGTVDVSMSGVIGLSSTALLKSSMKS